MASLIAACGWDALLPPPDVRTDDADEDRDKPNDSAIAATPPPLLLPAAPLPSCAFDAPNKIRISSKYVRGALGYFATSWRHSAGRSCWYDL